MSRCAPHRCRCRPLVALVLVLVVWPALAAAQGAAPDDAPARALALHDEARTLYARGSYRGALEKLQQAVQIDPKAKLLYYNLGLVEEKLGDLDAALRYYRQTLELERDASERVGLAHTIVRVEGARQQQRRAEFRPVAPTPRHAAPASAATTPRRSLLPWSYLTAGTAMAAFTTGAVLGGVAMATDPGRTPGTSPETSIDSLQQDAAVAHRLAVGADIALATGAAAAVATMVLLLVDAQLNRYPAADDHRSALRRLGACSSPALAGGGMRWLF